MDDGDRYDVPKQRDSKLRQTLTYLSAGKQAAATVNKLPWI